MTRLASIAGLLALLVGTAPAQAQLDGGLLGDSSVSSGSSGASTAPSAPREDRRSSRRGGSSGGGGTRSQISPYLELDQTAIWDLNGGGDVLTFTTVAVGVNASIETRSVSVGADVRYAHQFGWNDNSFDSDMISGIVTSRFDVVRNLLSLEAGALATRTRSDFRGASTALAGASATDKVYSFYVGPNFTAPIGDLTVTAAYRLGYNRVDQDNDVAAAIGVPIAASFEESWIHNANASIGMQPGVLPFGWSVGAGYVRETSSLLDQRFEDKFARADVTLPISPSVALVGGVGYEKIEISNKDAVRDVNGQPVRDSSGRFVTDANAPRRLSYDQDGLIWDAGVMWRPSPRLQAEARVGQRYGSTIYTGSLSWQPSRRTSIGVALFDSVDGFGRALNGSLANLGTDFTVLRNPFSGDIGGCAFNVGGQAGGACFGDTLTGIGSANFRNRGIVAQIARAGDPWNVTVAAGYVRRKFIADPTSVLAPVNGLVDQNYFATVGVQRPVDTLSTFDVQAYFNYFDTGIGGVDDVTNIGANASYRRTIWRRLTASGAIGVDSIDRKGQEAFVSLLAQIGLRYQF